MEESLNICENMEENVNDCGDTEESLNICRYIEDVFNIEKPDFRTMSPLNYAFIGDCIFDLVVRTIYVSKGTTSVNKLHKNCSAHVRAGAQMQIFKLIEEELSEEELLIAKRGRNAKIHSSAKNATLREYRYATGMETMVGYLYMKGEMKRVVELMKMGIERFDKI